MITGRTHSVRPVIICLHKTVLSWCYHVQALFRTWPGSEKLIVKSGHRSTFSRFAAIYRASCLALNAAEVPVPRQIASADAMFRDDFPSLLWDIAGSWKARKPSDPCWSDGFLHHTLFSSAGVRSTHFSRGSPSKQHTASSPIPTVNAFRP